MFAGFHGPAGSDQGGGKPVMGKGGTSCRGPVGENESLFRNF